MNYINQQRIKAMKNMKRSAFALSILIALLCVSGCTNDDDAFRALNAEGYTNIQTGGYAFFACSKDDFYHTSFTAKNAKGKTVEGVVCSGLFFKGSTIRY